MRCWTAGPQRSRYRWSHCGGGWRSARCGERLGQFGRVYRQLVLGRQLRLHMLLLDLLRAGQ
jgi:hypothetical protein